MVDLVDLVNLVATPGNAIAQPKPAALWRVYAGKDYS